MKKSIFTLITLLMAISFTMNAQTQKQTKIQISTDYGVITAVLYNETPQHRDNFIKLVKEGWFENSPFHRVIKEFMIQGGQSSDGKMDPGYKVPAEFSTQLFHKKGALAAARQGDQVNPKKESSGSQFYIVQGKVYTNQDLDMLVGRSGKTMTDDMRKAYTTVGGTPFLDGEYTVFGQVTDGMDVIDKIAAVQTAPGDKPVKDVKMKIKIIE